MELNPYQSPKVGQPLPEDLLANSESIRHLLAEIRDAQRETVELLRQAEQRNTRARRWLPLTMLLPLLIFGLVIAMNYFLLRPMRSVPTTPYRTPVRVSP